MLSISRRGAQGLLASIAACAALLPAPVAAQTVEEFYKGRSIDLVIGFSAGGAYDVYARVVAKHISNHIPGRPTIVARQMTGGGSRVAANFVYNVAPKDGSVIATVDQSLALGQAFGDTTIKFDAKAFGYIGNPITDNNTMAAWHASGLTRWEQAKERTVSYGATGPNTSAWYGMAMNALLGTKFRIITGYPGGNDVNLALERGEVEVRGSNLWSSWKGTRPQWIAEKKIIQLVQIGLAKSPELPDVPLLMDLPNNEADRAVMRLLSAPTAVGRPLFTPPGVPADRLAALRKAFDATMTDPAFIAEAKASQLDLNPMSGAQLQKVVEDIVSTPPAVVERLKTILEIK